MTDLAKNALHPETLTAIHKSAVDAIITITETGIICTVNPATESLFGYTVDELVGNNVNMLMPSPFHEEHNGYLKNYLRSSIPKIIGIGREVVGKKKDGSTFPAHLAVNEVNIDGRRVFAGFIRDLSDLKLIQEKEAILGSIIEDSLNEVFIFDAETMKFIQVNRGARENLGYSMEELLRLTPVDIKPKFTRKEFKKLVQPLSKRELAKLNFKTVHQRKDGSNYDVDVYLQMATYGMNPVFVAIILDITERLEQERLIKKQQDDMQASLEELVDTRTAELRETQAELVRSEKYSTLGKVSGGIAHEIRNPLNAVKTSAYYLLNAQNPTPKKVTEHLERIDRQVSMIDNVITVLADVAKMPEANLSPVAIVPVLREVLNSTNVPANIQSVLEVPDSLPKVLVDESQIVIAFRNLVRNARDAMPEGGTITISAMVQDNKVVLTVEDTGIGISSRDLERILEPLFTTKARGMGLGLSITRAIVEKNQGALLVDSEPGKGSKFSVVLGLNAPSTATARSPN